MEREGGGANEGTAGSWRPAGQRDGTRGRERCLREGEGLIHAARPLRCSSLRCSPLLRRCSPPLRRGLRLDSVHPNRSTLPAAPGRAWKSGGCWVGPMGPRPWERAASLPRTSESRRLPVCATHGHFTVSQKRQSAASAAHGGCARHASRHDAGGSRTADGWTRAHATGSHVRMFPRNLWVPRSSGQR